MNLPTKLGSAVLGVVTVAVLGFAPGTSAAGYGWRDVRHPTVTVDLAGVAAPAARDVWAVGQRLTDDSRLVGYAEHWNGRRWAEATLPGEDYHTYTDVAAGSSDDVWVLADTHGQGQVFKHWDGRSWAQVPPATLPGHPGATVLRGVAALEDGTAWAVGFNTVNYPYDTVVQRWDGQRWQQVPTPYQHIELQAVSAVADDDVWAAGWLDQAGYGVLATMHWDGQVWHTVTHPIPGEHAQLMDIAAVSGTEVWAAGMSEGRPIAMRWNGTRWHVLPRLALDTTSVDAVLPDGSGGVWLAGNDYSADEPGRTPLYLHWDGTAWTRATSRQPEGAVYDLTRVGTASWAVGTTTSCGCFVGQPLVQRHGRHGRG